MRGEPGSGNTILSPSQHFNSLAPCGANPTDPRAAEPADEISTHSPRAGRTNLHSSIGGSNTDFNSLAPCGANRVLCAYKSHLPTFQLTRPVRGEPVDRPRCVSWFSFQLTRPVRGEPLSLCVRSARWRISTHSPRAGRTNALIQPFYNSVYFNSLAPCGANPIIDICIFGYIEFQLTRPVRGEPSIIWTL